MRQKASGWLYNHGTRYGLFMLELLHEWEINSKLLKLLLLEYLLQMQNILNNQNDYNAFNYTLKNAAIL